MIIGEKGKERGEERRERKDKQSYDNKGKGKDREEEERRGKRREEKGKTNRITIIGRKKYSSTIMCLIGIKKDSIKGNRGLKNRSIINSTTNNSKIMIIRSIIEGSKSIIIIINIRMNNISTTTIKMSVIKVKTAVGKGEFLRLRISQYQFTQYNTTTKQGTVKLKCAICPQSRYDVAASA